MQVQKHPGNVYVNLSESQNFGSRLPIIMRTIITSDIVRSLGVSGIGEAGLGTGSEIVDRHDLFATIYGHH